jgi:hypothetical protein
MQIVDTMNIANPSKGCAKRRGSDTMERIESIIG